MSFHLNRRHLTRLDEKAESAERGASVNLTPYEATTKGVRSRLDWIWVIGGTGFVCWMKAEWWRKEVFVTSGFFGELTGRYRGALVVMEAGCHSPWISRYLEAPGCE